MFRSIILIISVKIHHSFSNIQERNAKLLAFLSVENINVLNNLISYSFEAKLHIVKINLIMKNLTILLTVIFVLFSCAQDQIQVSDKTKPLNIILMIGDGMGLSQIQAAYTVNKGKLEFLNFPVVGLQKTHSADNYITDSAAGATALATGTKTSNKTVSLDTNELELKSIIKYAEENGLSTGLVATSAITHATPACFIANQKSRYMEEEIASDFLETDVDVFIGGGLKFFKNREDKVDLTEKLKEKGYSVLTNIDSIKNFKGDKLAGLIAENKPKKISTGRGDMLSVATSKALAILSKNEKGFFLLVEGSQIDWGGHDNDANYVVNELLDFNKAITIVNNFVKENGNTLVIVTADHETGGLMVLDGDLTKGTIETNFAKTQHTGTMVPVFANGIGAEKFTGVYENTAIFEKMMTLFNFQK